jgi:bifunctional NMN adenylyltransferase/nudix hydrolase
MKLGVLIGRFQVPGGPHEGHLHLISRIREVSDETLILFGSANRAPSLRNPFSFLERVREMSKHFPDVLCAPLNDYMYSDAQWKVDVVNTIEFIITQAPATRGIPRADIEVTLYGHFKEGDDYMHWFPQFKTQKIESEITVSGTEMRKSHEFLLPPSVRADIKEYERDEQRFRDYPFPEALNINCGDAVLECLRHVLLVKRKFAPGAGTWALPGGHKNRNETFLECALRELGEETNVQIPKNVLMGSVVGTRLFDSPSRCNGTPKSTLAVHMLVQPTNDGKLPRVNGSDDAAEARWVPLTEVMNSYMLYDDHSDIISVMTGVKPIIAYARSFK